MTKLKFTRLPLSLTIEHVCGARLTLTLLEEGYLKSVDLSARTADPVFFGLEDLFPIGNARHNFWQLVALSSQPRS